jgi:ATP-dependent DNA helicase RecG
VGNHPGYRFAQIDNDSIELANGIDVNVHSDDYYEDLIIGLIKENESVNRKQVDELIIPKLKAYPTEEKKNRKVGNLLTKMKNKDLICNNGTRKMSEWVLKNKE